MASKLPQKIDTQVGKRVRMRRLMVGMSQDALAKELGLTFQQVQKYEKGSNRISASRMKQIADALDVPMAYLFEDFETSTEKRTDRASERLNDFLATKDGLALIDAFSQIHSAKLRRHIVELVRTIAANSSRSA